MERSEYDLLGRVVRIKAGVCGEGYRFIVQQVLDGADGAQVYGPNYGPVRASDVEVVS